MDDITIKVADNGPLIVTGSISMLDGEGNEYALERSRVALCRCGRSSNKPFCDGTHAKIGFTSRARVPETDRTDAKTA